MNNKQLLEYIEGSEKRVEESYRKIQILNKEIDDILCG